MERIKRVIGMYIILVAKAILFTAQFYKMNPI